MAVYFVNDVNTTSEGKTIYIIYNFDMGSMSSKGPFNLTKEQVKELIKAGNHLSGYKLDTLGRLIKDNSADKEYEKSKAAEGQLVKYMENLKGTLLFRPMYFKEEEYDDPKYRKHMLEEVFDKGLLKAVQPLLKEYEVGHVFEIVDQILKERSRQFKYSIAFNEEINYNTHNWFISTEDNQVMYIIKEASDMLFETYADELNIYNSLTDNSYCYPVLKFLNVLGNHGINVKTITNKEIIRFLYSERYFKGYYASQSIIDYCNKYLEKHWYPSDEVTLFDDCVKSAKVLDNYIEDTFGEGQHIIGLDGYNNPKKYIKDLCIKAKAQKEKYDCRAFSDFGRSVVCNADEYAALISTIAVLGKKEPSRLEFNGFNEIIIKDVKLKVSFNYDHNNDGNSVTIVRYLG